MDRRNNYKVPKAGFSIVKNYVQIWLRYVTLKYFLVFLKHSEFIVLKSVLWNYLEYGIIMYSHPYYVT